jgi:hypothetical protein
MAELVGIAEGFGIAEEELFAHLHLSILRDRKQAVAGIDTDGCSAWAVGAGPDGPLLVKNRDFAGAHLGVQRVCRHEGPDIATGAMLCVGSLGATGAYSSGINAAGLALADTAVATSDHGVGWLRYFLMSRILAECATVAEAVVFVRACDHAGGGSLIVVDRSGFVAAIELGHSRVEVERGSLAFRTNHFVSPALADATLDAGNDRVAQNSHGRFAILSARLRAVEWTAANAATLMGSHGETLDDASLCQHAGAGETSTISSAVFACRSGTLYLAEGNPCGGRWKGYGLDR